jgi:hypothetical protein
VARWGNARLLRGLRWRRKNLFRPAAELAVAACAGGFACALDGAEGPPLFGKVGANGWVKVFGAHAALRDLRPVLVVTWAIWLA